MTKKKTAVDDRAKRGGEARASALPPGVRREIASRAAIVRWDRENDIPEAKHIGDLKVGEMVLSCAVLPDGVRVISQGNVTQAFGPVTGGYQARKRESDEHSGDLPPFLIASALKDFISDDLRTLVASQRRYRDPRGGPIRLGLEATLLPKICEVWLKARDAKVLTKQQRGVAERADVLMRGLAHTGIIALVDEATGFQETRDKQALQAILDSFLRTELAAWAKKFPDEFYKQMFRLRGWVWKGMSVGKPQAVGNYTRDLVYARLAPGILNELEERMPRDDNGRKKGRYHQLLTDDIGHPALAQHLHAIIGLMRVARDGQWDSFMKMINIAFPKRGDTLAMDFMKETPRLAP
jgi:hypothetical protein